MSKQNPFSFPEDLKSPTYDAEKGVTDAAADYIWAREQGGGAAAAPVLKKLDDLIDQAQVPAATKAVMKRKRDQLVNDWDSQPEVY